VNRSGGAFPKSLNQDRGSSLILVMLALVLLSVLTAAMVVSTRSETLASYNYKLNTQADYLAKAGIQQAVNWFRSQRYQPVSQSQAYTYYALTQDATALSLYTANTTPVRCKSGCSSLNSPVRLIGYGSGSSNYPGINNAGGTDVAAAFTNDLVNVRVTGDPRNSGTFSIRATLLNYQTVNTGGTCPTPLGGAPPCPVETWLITSLGTWTGGSSQTGTVATAEEQAIIQPVYTPTWGNALYGWCGVWMHGSAGVCTDSFNSSLGQYGGGNVSVASGHCDSSSTNVIDAGAGVGANGGVTLGSNVVVSGDVTIGSAPATPCPYNGFSGNVSSVLGEVVAGPHMAPPPAPAFRSGFPSGAPAYDHVSAVLPAGATWPSPFTNFPSGTGTAPPFSQHSPCMDSTCDGTLAHPYEAGAISLTASDHVQLIGGPDMLHPVYYDIDSIDESGNGEIDVSGFVVLNIKSGFNIKGNGMTNGVSGVANIPPECVQINYAGTSSLTMGGNGAISAIISAPNADASLGGGGSSGYLVGSLQAKTIDDGGGYPVHYDLQLNRLGGIIGKVANTSYSRQKM
jgi:hypothetical protein